ncbi:nucleotide exchange factor GrpE [Vagococcus elongatus]|uniref:Protein GrpE n=1 Tax=Vagococcus elongatus TaxID=180344 RepID=A0A430AMA6_9ENTE|nr:nucleotide exchange factor GrpE [Vagococcus elongatus]RSU09083.1 nucleotide exchange factor GrpE [Vagococcus elongatus]
MSKVAEEQKEETLEEVTDEAVENVATDEEEQASTASIEALSSEEQLKLELEEAEDKFLRAQAEIANMRNRFQKERESLARFRSQDLAKELLPALDNLDRALETDISEEQVENLKKGVEMVKDGILAAFKASGIEEIEALGKVFDPNLHQAVQTMPIEEGQQVEEVVVVLQKGYKLYDRVLRPSMVIVAQ